MAGVDDTTTFPPTTSSVPPTTSSVPPTTTSVPPTTTPPTTTSVPQKTATLTAEQESGKIKFSCLFANLPSNYQILSTDVIVNDKNSSAPAVMYSVEVDLVGQNTIIFELNSNELAVGVQNFVTLWTNYSYLENDHGSLPGPHGVHTHTAQIMSNVLLVQNKTKPLPATLAVSNTLEALDRKIRIALANSYTVNSLNDGFSPITSVTLLVSSYNSDQVFAQSYDLVVNKIGNSYDDNIIVPQNGEFESGSYEVCMITTNTLGSSTISDTVLLNLTDTPNPVDPPTIELLNGVTIVRYNQPSDAVTLANNLAPIETCTITQYEYDRSGALIGTPLTFNQPDLTATSMSIPYLNRAGRCFAYAVTFENKNGATTSGQSLKKIVYKNPNQQLFTMEHIFDDDNQPTGEFLATLASTDGSNGLASLEGTDEIDFTMGEKREVSSNPLGTPYMSTVQLKLTRKTGTGSSIMQTSEYVTFTRKILTSTDTQVTLGGWTATFPVAQTGVLTTYEVQRVGANPNRLQNVVVTENMKVFGEAGVQQEIRVVKPPTPGALSISFLDGDNKLLTQNGVLKVRVNITQLTPEQKAAIGERNVYYELIINNVPLTNFLHQVNPLYFDLNASQLNGTFGEPRSLAVRCTVPLFNGGFAASDLTDSISVTPFDHPLAVNNLTMTATEDITLTWDALSTARRNGSLATNIFYNVALFEDGGTDPFYNERTQLTTITKTKAQLIAIAEFTYAYNKRIVAIVLPEVKVIENNVTNYISDPDSATLKSAVLSEPPLNVTNLDIIASSSKVGSQYVPKITFQYDAPENLTSDYGLSTTATYRLYVNKTPYTANYDLTKFASSVTSSSEVSLFRDNNDERITSDSPYYIATSVKAQSGNVNLNQTTYLFDGYNYTIPSLVPVQNIDGMLYYTNTPYYANSYDLLVDDGYKKIPEVEISAGETDITIKTTIDESVEGLYIILNNGDALNVNNTEVPNFDSKDVSNNVNTTILETLYNGAVTYIKTTENSVDKANVTFKNLKAGTIYTASVRFYMVKQISSSDVRIYSNNVDVNVSPQSPPSKVQNLDFTIGPNTVTAFWDPPQVSGTVSALLQYKVSIIDGTESKDVETDGTSLTINGLENKLLTLSVNAFYTLPNGSRSDGDAETKDIKPGTAPLDVDVSIVSAQESMVNIKVTIPSDAGTYGIDKIWIDISKDLAFNDIVSGDDLYIDPIGNEFIANSVHLKTIGPKDYLYNGERYYVRTRSDSTYTTAQDHGSTKASFVPHLAKPIITTTSSVRSGETITYTIQGVQNGGSLAYSSLTIIAKCRQLTDDKPVITVKAFTSAQLADDMYQARQPRGIYGDVRLAEGQHFTINADVPIGTNVLDTTLFLFLNENGHDGHIDPLANASDFY
jgi:hypothetical protein